MKGLPLLASRCHRKTSMKIPIPSSFGLVWNCLLALLVLGQAAARAQLPVIPQDVIAHIHSRVTNGFTPGIVVGMVNSAGASYYSYGVGNLDTGAAVNEDSIFEIGSITKTFTGTLLSQLVLAGDMVLTDPVKNYLPENVRVPSRNGKVITLRHLATHRSGLPRMPTNWNPADLLNPYADYTVQQMYDFLSSYELTRDPGASYEYSNFGMGLVGYVLSLKTGTDYAALVSERITGILGMNDTGISLSARMLRNLAPGHSGIVQVPNWDLGPAFAGAGALRSSARDLLQYVAANMGLVPTDLYAAMTNAHVILAPAFTGSSLGLAWFTTPVTGDQMIWHDGGTGGYRSYAGFLKNKQLGVVVFASSDFDVSDLGAHLLATIQPLRSIPKTVQVDLNTLQSCVGRYQGTGGDYFDIGFGHDHLTCAYSGDRGASYTFYPSSLWTFFLTVVDASARFQANSQGLVTKLAWTQNGQSSTYNRVSAPIRLSIQHGNGETQIKFTGDPGINYVLDAGNDLIHWTPIATNTIWTAPFVDREPANSRFYRVRRE
jgi:serine-type D-Ala-D-Ala carboxypeptidase/endopeptidase